MLSEVNALAGKPATPEILINVQQLISAYYSEIPDPFVAAQRVIFGTSGHRGCALDKSFNEWHILAISQAICQYRQLHQITGPLFLGVDTHALSTPAFASALEVFAANEVEVLIAAKQEYTPTPVISHAILRYNKERNTGLADGIIVTPSHDPPHDGGFKYNPPNGGPADLNITGWIEKTANGLLENGLNGVKRISFDSALHASSTHQYDYINTYIKDLNNIIDMEVIRSANIRIGVDPLGGAGVHYWPLIAQHYGLDLTVVNPVVDPTFSFMTVDWDGQIRMDPSSPYAMERLIGLKGSFDIAFACDTDHDRHGIVTPSVGLMPPNHYLCAAIAYLVKHREQWRATAKIGKTMVSSQMIARVANNLQRQIYEVPVGFKWFSQGLLDGELEFCGEESAGSSFCRMDGSVWTTDKDGITAALLAAEMTARLGRDPGMLYTDLEGKLGKSFFKRIDAPATASQKKCLSSLTAQQIHAGELANEKIQSILSKAPGNDQAFGGIKITTDNGWFAARPSGTEDIFRLYAESFKSEQHLQAILIDAQKMISTVFEESQP